MMPTLYETCADALATTAARAGRPSNSGRTWLASSTRCRTFRRRSVVLRWSGVEDLVDRKRDILGYYRERLGSLSGVSVNPGTRRHSEWGLDANCCLSTENSGDAGSLQSAFAAENIDARVFFYPLSSLPMFEDRPSNKHAWEIPGRAINLPSLSRCHHRGTGSR